MRNLSFKTKVLILMLVPLIAVSCLVTGLILYQAKQLGDKNIESFSSKIFDIRREELKNYTDIAVSAVSHLTNDQTLNSPIAEEEVKRIIRNLAFGKDGYFYAYEGYVTMAHPTVSSLEGKNNRDLTDPNGVKIIQDLYNAAQRGGDATSYIWMKPSRNREVEKIGYADSLPGWDWWIGTGLYVDDLEDAVAALEGSIDENITTTLQLVLAMAVGACLLVGVVGVRFTLSEGKLADRRLQMMSTKSVSSREEERSRVARQLQKNINQALITSRANLQKVAKQNTLKTSDSRADFVRAVSSLNQAIKEVYKMSGELRPQIIEKQGLMSAIEELANQLSLDNNVKINFAKSKMDVRLKSDVEVTVYRIIQKALDNVVNHSGASIANVRVAFKRNLLELSVVDNGIGFNVDQEMDAGGKASSGLVEMQMLTESLGGQFSVNSEKNKATTVMVSIPV